MAHLDRLVSSLPTPAVAPSASPAAGSNSQATALPADPLTAIPATQAATKPALTSPCSTVAAAGAAAASPQKPSEPAVSPQLPVSAAAATAQNSDDSKGLGFVSHGPAPHITEDAGCQANGSAAASQQPAYAQAAKGLAYRECCGLAEVITRDGLLKCTSKPIAWRQIQHASLEARLGGLGLPNA